MEQRQQSNNDNRHEGQLLEDRLRAMMLQDQTTASNLQQQSGNNRNTSSYYNRAQQQPRNPGTHPQPNQQRPVSFSRGQGAPNIMHRNNRNSREPPPGRGAANFGNGATPTGPRQTQPPPGGPPHGHSSTPSRRAGHASNFSPLPRPRGSYKDRLHAQCEYLDALVHREVPNLQISSEELASKEKFRLYLEQILQEVVARFYYPPVANVKLICFGSVSSGFGTPGSDMDLALVSPLALPEVLRHFEKCLLDRGHGARLLTRTRVPILKICQLPTSELLSALREEREKWDQMTDEERENYDHPVRGDEIATQKPPAGNDNITDAPLEGPKAEGAESVAAQTNSVETTHRNIGRPGFNSQQTTNSDDLTAQLQQGLQALNIGEGATQGFRRDQNHARVRKPWYREKALGKLDFPKDGIGIQCDVNEENPLGIHNTALLRCYSLCDPRVTPIVLFVKAWASRRKINSARYGTLSSYGYVLMVLHFLVNVAKPWVCPNLQLMVDPDEAYCNGFSIRFWREETKIRDLATRGQLSHNNQSVGELLRNFFRYYADQSMQDSGVPGFVWTREVLSLRSNGGILSKEQKGWTGAKVTVQDNVEVRHRYLFAIEDPFETTHNVARPVTHNGIVAIRDEFRRAWRILCQIGNRANPEGLLLEEIVDQQPPAEEQSQADKQSAEQPLG